MHAQTTQAYGNTYSTGPTVTGIQAIAPSSPVQEIRAASDEVLKLAQEVAGQLRELRSRMLGERPEPGAPEGVRQQQSGFLAEIHARFVDVRVLLNTSHGLISELRSATEA